MKTIDCSGLSCPLPVIETKKALEEGHVDNLAVIVDNLTSRENVMRFLQSQGFSVSVMEENEKHRIEATKVQSDGKAIKTEKNSLSSSMGRQWAAAARNSAKYLCVPSL